MAKLSDKEAKMQKRDRAFGYTVNIIRRSKKRTQEEIANELFMDPSTWRKIELGKRRVDRELTEEVTGVLKPTPLQEALLFALADLFEVGLMSYLGMPREISSSFVEMEVEKKSLSELEELMQHQIQKACLKIYPQIKKQLWDWLTCAHFINGIINSSRELDQV